MSDTITHIINGLFITVGTCTFSYLIGLFLSYGWHKGKPPQAIEFTSAPFVIKTDATPAQDGEK